MIQTSVEKDVSHITGRCCVKNHGRPRSPDFEELRLGNFEALFLYLQAESHVCITRNATFLKTTTVDIKIMYTIINTKKNTKCKM